MPLVKKLENLYKKRYFNFFYLFILGGVSSLSLPPYNIFLINFISFSLFFIFLFNNRKENIDHLSHFKYGWFFGLGYFFCSLYWIAIALTFDENFQILMPVAIILVPSFLAIFYGIISYFFSIFFSKKIIISFLLFSILFGLIEFIRGHIFTGFPWNLIAYSFSENNNFIQIISVIGMYSFNLICISFFTCPAILILKTSKNEIFTCSILFVIAIFFSIYGDLKTKKFNLIDDIEHEYIIRVVSPNVTLDRFYNGQDELKIINELILLSNPKFSEKTIFLWPEGIVHNTNLNDFKIYKDLFTKHFNQNHAIILGINNVVSHNGKKNYFNSLAVFNSRLNLLDFYNKINLVPFGEFLPFSNILEKIGLKTITNNYQSYSAGKSRNIINLKNKKFDVSFLPLICYEIIYTGNLSKNTNYSFIVNISEDGWFGKSIGPKQHLIHSVFRSIENGKYILRSANNGISAIINPVGKINQKVEFGTVGYIDFIQSKSTETTLFSKYGNKLFIIVILLYIFLIFSFNKIKNE